MIENHNISKGVIDTLNAYLEKVPYNVMPMSLYTSDILFDKFDAGNPDSFNQCYDTVVYNHVVSTGKTSQNHLEEAARSMHDCCMRVCLQTFLSKYDERHTVGIMGGHAMLRTDEAYLETVLISKELTERGYLMLSGGGPGAMEATHLGAWLAGRSYDEVLEALDIIKVAPCFKSEGWLATSLELKKRFPRIGDACSLAIPTWFYGHEPPTAFATHIAKFFDNSVREDTILTEAYGGLIYMPGSAGTLQEIFQEAVQNHYLTFGFPSPMIFMGSKFWSETVPAVPFINTLIENGVYKNMIVELHDKKEDIIKAIIDFAEKK